jgi:predicted small secreted protein
MILLANIGPPAAVSRKVAPRLRDNSARESRPQAVDGCLGSSHGHFAATIIRHSGAAQAANPRRGKEMRVIVTIAVIAGALLTAGCKTFQGSVRDVASVGLSIAGAAGQS